MLNNRNMTKTHAHVSEVIQLSVCLWMWMWSQGQGQALPNWPVTVKHVRRLVLDVTDHALSASRGRAWCEVARCPCSIIIARCCVGWKCSRPSSSSSVRLTVRHRRGPDNSPLLTPPPRCPSTGWRWVPSPQNRPPCTTAPRAALARSLAADSFTPSRPDPCRLMPSTTRRLCTQPPPLPLRPTFRSVHPTRRRSTRLW